MNFFLFGFYDPSKLFHSFWAEAKTGDPREKPRDQPQTELGLSHMWPELGLQFRVLKFRVLNK